jgi:PIN domain nuclease of toxin-antitoxin system
MSKYQPLEDYKMMPLLLATRDLGRGRRAHRGCRGAELDAALAEGTDVSVSPMTASELGLVVARGNLAISVSPEAWVEPLLAVPRVALAAMAPAVLIAASFLPGRPPRDPVNRTLVATGRAYGYRRVARDAALLACAELGHHSAVVC